MDNRQPSMWRIWPALRRRRGASAAAVIVALTVGVLGYLGSRAGGSEAPNSDAVSKAAAPSSSSNTVVLSDSQLQMINVGTVSEYTFPLQREAVGNIDFNEDMQTQVFPPYQGRIAQLFAKLGDNVAKGQALFTIESPDLIQAESGLIAAAAVLDLTTSTLERAKQLHDVQGIADKDLEQAVSDQQTAEGALKAARDGVAVFGKSPAEIDRMVRTRSIDPYLLVLSPVGGRVTARNAAPGVFVQPGNPPAPYSVADISRIWLNASVTESDMPLVKKGQQIRVAVMAFPDRTFEGRISTVGSTVDSQLHRGLVRAEIDDPKHELLPGMFAAFVIVTGEPVKAPAMPLDGVVREGDGSMTVWVTSDGHHFTQRSVRLGLQSGGFDQVIDGVRLGERVVVKGAIILDNMVNGGES
ncbi:MAG: efflux RND transporter periplasmic adaptor subunit [Steroidobacterales bacterium]